MECAICGKVANPLIYRPDMVVIGGEFAKCPKCGKVFCDKCAVVRWKDKAHEVGFNACPLDNEYLKTDLFS
jgi:uncharacterized C2H2 Zn-finger protein